MGGKNSTTGKNSKVPDKPLKLTDKDYKFLIGATGLSKDVINATFQQFLANNPDGKLDVNEFNRLYQSLRSEPVANLDEIDDLVFRAFDSDNNGFLTFNEFMVAYALTSRGDLKHKLEYAFELYDADNNGWLSSDEVRQVVSAMFDLLGIDRRFDNPREVADECARQIDTSHDGKITKTEFVNGLLQNYNLRAIMSPFN